MSIEQRLAELWQELLGVDSVGLQDGFFDLGGHSLIAVRLFARIRKMWGVDMPLASLFIAPTLEALAAEVRTRLGVTFEVSRGADGVAGPVSRGPLVAARDDPQGGIAATLLLRPRRRRQSAQLPGLRRAPVARAAGLRSRGARGRWSAAARRLDRGDGRPVSRSRSRAAAARAIPARRLLGRRSRRARDGAQACRRRRADRERRPPRHVSSVDDAAQARVARSREEPLAVRSSVSVDTWKRYRHAPHDMGQPEQAAGGVSESRRTRAPRIAGMAHHDDVHRRVEAPRGGPVCGTRHDVPCGRDRQRLRPHGTAPRVGGVGAPAARRD